MPETRAEARNPHRTKEQKKIVWLRDFGHVVPICVELVDAIEAQFIFSIDRSWVFEWNYKLFAYGDLVFFFWEKGKKL